MNPTKKVVYANNVPTKGSKFGKNSLLSTRGVTTPNRKKSYHSIVVPIALAKAIVPIDVPKPPDGDRDCIVFPPLFLPSRFILSAVARFYVLPQRLLDVAQNWRTSLPAAQPTRRCF